MSSSEQNDRFRISLPPGWDDQTVYHFKGPDEDGQEHKLMLVVTRHLQYESVREFARSNTEPITSSFQSVEVLKDEEVTIEHGLPTWEFVYRWNLADDMSIIEKRVFVIKSGLGFAFSISFSKKSYKTVGAGLDDVIDAILPGSYNPVEEN
jgi:hypothetical protein